MREPPREPPSGSALLGSDLLALTLYFDKIPVTSEILAQERAKIVELLNDLAELKFFAIGAQRKRLGNIEQILRLALFENKLELRRAQSAGQNALMCDSLA